MSAAIALREDYDAGDLRRLARASNDADQIRRLLALAEIYAGGERTKAAQLGAVQLQSIRDWVIWFNVHGPDGLIDGKAPGQPSKLDDRQRQALAAIVEGGPIPAIHGVVRWRLADLRQWIWQELAISLDESNLSRELKGLDFVKISARPRHHAQNQYVIDDFKTTSPPQWLKSTPNSRPTP